MDLSSAALKVSLALANWLRGKDAAFVQVSQKRLADEVGLSVRQVQRGLRELKRKKVLAQLQKRKGPSYYGFLADPWTVEQLKCIAADANPDKHDPVVNRVESWGDRNGAPGNRRKSKKANGEGPKWGPTIPASLIRVDTTKVSGLINKGSTERNNTYKEDSYQYESHQTHHREHDQDSLEIQHPISPLPPPGRCFDPPPWRSTTLKAEEPRVRSAHTRGSSPASGGGRLADPAFSIHPAMLGFCWGRGNPAGKSATGSVVTYTGTREDGSDPMQVDGIRPTSRQAAKKRRQDIPKELDDGKPHPEEERCPRKFRDGKARFTRKNIDLRLLGRRYYSLAKKHFPDVPFNMNGRAWNNLNELFAMLERDLPLAMELTTWVFENWKTAVPEEIDALAKAKFPTTGLLLGFRMSLLIAFKDSKKIKTKTAAWVQEILDRQEKDGILGRGKEEA
jgi:hypothetical protein